jgi:hypothetical protein
MKSYLIRPSVRKILYVLILSFGTFFLSLKFDDIIYQVVAAFAQVSALYVIGQRLFPRKLVLSDAQLMIPEFTPGRVKRLNFSEIQGYSVKRKNNRWTMLIKMKTGKKHSFDVDDVENWEKFDQAFSGRVQSLV